NLNIPIREINFGGGFGVYYTQEDKPFDIAEFLPDFIEHVHEKSTEYGIQLEKVTIEPGRSLVNNSGSTLYTIGDIKQTVGGKKYAFIDGGMTDNIRPALYQADTKQPCRIKLTNRLKKRTPLLVRPVRVGMS